MVKTVDELPATKCDDATCSCQQHKDNYHCGLCPTIWCKPRRLRAVYKHHQDTHWNHKTSYTCPFRKSGKMLLIYYI